MANVELGRQFRRLLLFIYLSLASKRRLQVLFVRRGLLALILFVIFVFIVYLNFLLSVLLQLTRICIARNVLGANWVFFFLFNRVDVVREAVSSLVEPVAAII